MRCLGCGYSLESIESGACPECGSRFDPADPATFDPGDPVDSRLHYWFRIAAAPLGVAPLANAVAAGLCWSAAYLALDRPPRPSADDPKGIPSIRFFYQVWEATAAPACISMVLGIGIASALAALPGTARQKRQSRIIAGIVIASWCVFFGLMISGVGTWLLD